MTDAGGADEPTFHGLHEVDRRTFLSRAGLVAAAAVAGAGVGIVVEPAIASEGPTARTAVPTAVTDARAATVTFRTQPATRLLALTIDDGPTAKWTPQVWEILQRHRVQATFFLVGERANLDPTQVKRAADAGHELGNHTWAHTDLTHPDETFIRDSLERTHELIARLTGRAPTICRPPYGRIDSVGLAACAALDYGVMLWSDHITGSNARADVDAVLRQATPGSVVLAHDGGPEPNATLMTQLDRLIGSLLDSGYTLATVSELLTARQRPASTAAAPPGSPAQTPTGG